MVMLNLVVEPEGELEADQRPDAEQDRDGRFSVERLEQAIDERVRVDQLGTRADEAEVAASGALRFAPPPGNGAEARGL
jgi:hypothetical protein